MDLQPGIWNFTGEVAFGSAEFHVRHPLAIAVVALVALAVAPPVPSDAGSCRHKGARNCFDMPKKLDFSSVSDISKRIVADEPEVQAPLSPAGDRQPSAAPYTGPMIGVANHIGAPTVGYYWSLH
jgi:hypothetical protein